MGVPVLCGTVLFVLGSYKMEQSSPCSSQKTEKKKKPFSAKVKIERKTEAILGLVRERARVWVRETYRDRVRNETEGNKPFKVCDFQKNREKDRSCFGLAREKGRRSSL